MPAKGKRIRIKCAQCGRTNMIPHNEMSFRVNNDGKALCSTCCKLKRWESPVCKGCSDRLICSGKYPEKIKEFIKGIGGV